MLALLTQQLWKHSWKTRPCRANNQLQRPYNPTSKSSRWIQRVWKTSQWSGSGCPHRRVTPDDAEATEVALRQTRSWMHGQVGTGSTWAHVFPKYHGGDSGQAESLTHLETAVATTPSVHPTGTPTANSHRFPPPVLDPLSFPPCWGHDPTLPPQEKGKRRISVSSETLFVARQSLSLL